MYLFSPCLIFLDPIIKGQQKQNMSESRQRQQLVRTCSTASWSLHTPFTSLSPCLTSESPHFADSITLFMSSNYLFHCLNTFLPIPISSIVPMSLKNNLKIFNLRKTLVLATVVLSLVRLVECQDVNDYNNQLDNPAALRLITSVVYNKVSNLTAAIGQDFSSRSSFCIKDWWVIRFNFAIFWELECWILLFWFHSGMNSQLK